MTTRKLYYEDCHLAHFSAKVTSCQKTPEGYWVSLDATAFYPEGGGQACDTGTLNHSRVLEVKEQGDEVFHLCDEPFPLGETVVGAIDYASRFERMQQHTGEHILSGIIFKKFGYHNVGFHMGQRAMEVDFDGPIPATFLAEIEKEANEAVWKNLPVLCSHPSQKALAHIPYRSKREIPWPVRIVEIPDYDCCACCGVHVERTGEIGLIKILSCVKLRQGVRLEVACGKQAYDWVQTVWEQNRRVSQCLSAEMGETGAAAEKICEALAAEKYRAEGLQEQIFQYIAESYVNQENIIHFHDALSSAQLRLLANAIADKCDGFAAVFSGEKEQYGFAIVSKTQDIAPLGREMTQALHGRGGGKSNFQQGRVQATREEIEAFFNEN